MYVKKKKKLCFTDQISTNSALSIPGTHAFLRCISESPLECGFMSWLVWEVARLQCSNTDLLLGSTERRDVKTAGVILILELEAGTRCGGWHRREHESTRGFLPGTESLPPPKVCPLPPARMPPEALIEQINAVHKWVTLFLPHTFAIYIELL